MNERVRTVLVLLFSLLAASVTYLYLAGIRETVTVIVATEDIPAGTKIENSMLSTMTVAKREQEVMAPNAIRQMTQILGRVPKRSIKKGAVLNLEPDIFYLTDEALKQVTGGAAPPAYLVPSGMVAVAIPAEADNSVGFTLQKNDLVNVIYTWKRGDEVVTKTILSQVRIFETGKAEGGLGGSDKAALRTVTLLVTPKDAEILVSAKRTGKVDLALVGRAE